jgi:WD repeat-containing protein 45
MMKLSRDGKLLATASGKGTLVRIWDTQTGDQLNELRRGADQAVVSDISFDPDNQYVACASDKGTVHMFNLGDEASNKKSSFSALSGMVSYFGSKWSASQMRINDTFSKCALMNGKIFAISTAGNYFVGEIGEGNIKVDM